MVPHHMKNCSCILKIPFLYTISAWYPRINIRMQQWLGWTQYFRSTKFTFKAFESGLEKNWSRLRLLMSQSRSHYNRSHKKHTFRPGRSHHSNHSHSRWFSLHTVINKRVSHSHNRNRSHKTCSHNRSHDRRSENSIAVTIAIATRESRSQSRSRKFLFVLFSTWSS